ncbi:MAG: SIMPL domain-containing protein [Myxococcales bacterium]|nr:SIMPL domain-containing protein [Myxococcota bacterium]MDW8284434.1 SIMPL domain-containing protein [Myxococcales bacterium]
MKQAHVGTLSVTGEGQVKVRPDIAWIHLTILTEAKVAQEAAEQNAARTAQLIEQMRGLGIPAEDLRTVGLHLYPVYSFEEGPDRGRLIGYRAEDTIRVEAPVELAGKVFDAGIAAGADQASSLSFGLRDEAPFRAQALVGAVEAARRDAEAVVTALGRQLLGVQSIEIEPGGGVMMRQTARAELRVTTPVLPGELTVTARVRLTYEFI